MVFSEEYTLDCGQNGGCNGDDNTTVLAWAKATGLPLTSDYGPYAGGCGFFGSCKYKTGQKLYTISDWGFADSNGGQGITSITDIKAAIMTYGAVGTAVAADNDFESWGDSSPSFNYPYQGDGSQAIDHDIILIGWQDDPKNPSGGYWILRNSWSEGWGVGGYMAIDYSVNCVGTESVWAVVTPSK